MNNNKLSIANNSNTGITKEQAIHYAKHLADLSCQHVILFDISSLYDYANYAIIATTLSDVHRRGLIEQMPEYFIEEGLQSYTDYCLNRNQANKMGGWVLVDLKDIIVHFMTENLRNFYELERLWFEAPVLYESE